MTFSSQAITPVPPYFQHNNEVILHAACQVFPHLERAYRQGGVHWEAGYLPWIQDGGDMLRGMHFRLNTQGLDMIVGVSHALRDRDGGGTPNPPAVGEMGVPMIMKIILRGHFTTYESPPIHIRRQQRGGGAMGKEDPRHHPDVDPGIIIEAFILAHRTFVLQVSEIMTAMADVVTLLMPGGVAPSVCNKGARGG